MAHPEHPLYYPELSDEPDGHSQEVASSQDLSSANPPEVPTFLGAIVDEPGIDLKAVAAVSGAETAIAAIDGVESTVRADDVEVAVSAPATVDIEHPIVDVVDSPVVERTATTDAVVANTASATELSVEEPVREEPGLVKPSTTEVNSKVTDKASRSLSMKAALRAYLSTTGITVLFDGSLRQNKLVTEQGLRSKIIMTMINRQYIEDEFSLSPEAHGMKSAEIKRVIRRVLDEEQRRRVADLAEPLFVPLTANEEENATNDWLLLASVFEQDAALTVAKLKHFMWQVKRKIIKAEVKRHMMLVVVGAKQGTGKTQFVDRMVSPWEEAATGPVLISDIADARSADIFRFPIAKIDDMEKVQRDKIAVLKSVITGTSLRRRMLGSMESTGFAQALTLVGTANHDILELVDDDSGHRRFASLTMREWAGGADSNPYWKIINATNFPLLWRSVSAADTAPIEDVLDLLESEQTSGALKTSLLTWLQQFDHDAPEALAIARHDGFGASGLYELFVAQTDSLMSQTEFGMRMRRYAGRHDVPFGIKKKTAESNIYPLKVRRNRP